MKIKTDIIKIKKMLINFNETDVPHLKRVFKIFLENFDKDEKLIRVVNHWLEKIAVAESRDEDEIVSKSVEKVEKDIKKDENK